MSYELRKLRYYVPYKTFLQHNYSIDYILSNSDVICTFNNKIGLLDIRKVTSSLRACEDELSGVAFLFFVKDNNKDVIRSVVIPIREDVLSFYGHIAEDGDSLKIIEHVLYLNDYEVINFDEGIKIFDYKIGNGEDMATSLQEALHILYGRKEGLPDVLKKITPPARFKLFRMVAEGYPVGIVLMNIIDLYGEINIYDAWKILKFLFTLSGRTTKKGRIISYDYVRTLFWIAHELGLIKKTRWEASKRSPLGRQYYTLTSRGVRDMRAWALISMKEDIDTLRKMI